MPDKTYTKEHVIRLMQLAYIAGYEGPMDLMDEEIESILEIEPPVKPQYPKNIANMVKDIMKGKRAGDIRSPVDDKIIPFSSEGVLQNTYKEATTTDIIDYNAKLYTDVAYGIEI